MYNTCSLPFFRSPQESLETVFYDDAPVGVSQGYWVRPAFGVRSCTFEVVPSTGMLSAFFFLCSTTSAV